MMKKSIKILFVCNMNLLRSKTAEDLYKSDTRFSVRSAGINPKATKVLEESDLFWADYIVVMEKEQKQFIESHFSPLKARQSVVCFNIEDIYWYMDGTLVGLINEQMNNFF